MTDPATAARCITFGDDGSAGADIAWDWLIAQAWPGWQVDVLRAASTPAAGGPGDPTRWAPSRCGFTSVRAVASPLDPKLALPSHSGTDLIVIGPHRRGTDRAVDLGSTARAIAMEAELPVVIGNGAGAARSVVACVDGSSGSREALRVLAQLPLSRTAAVTLLTVRSTGEESASGASAATSQAQELLLGLGLRASVRTAEPAESAVLASPAHRILDFADRAKPDLLVLGRSGRGSVGRLVSGSVAAHVAGKARCSVLIAGR